MRFTLKTREVFTKIVLVHLCLLILNNCFYIHTHISQDGRVVIHHHPFNDDDHSYNSEGDLEHCAFIFALGFPITETQKLEGNIFYSIIEFSQKILSESKTIEIISKQAPRAPPTA